MKKFPYICLLSLLALGSSQAAIYQFDNSDGNRLFSGANNWNYVSGAPAGTFPVNNDTLRVDHTLFTTTLLAPALIDSAWSVTGGGTFFAGPGTAYGLVQNSANLRPSNLNIGGAATAGNHGFVTVATGGEVSTGAANHDAVHGVISGQFGEYPGQLPPHGHGNGVESAGVGEGYGGDCPGALQGNGAGVGRLGHGAGE